MYTSGIKPKAGELFGFKGVKAECVKDRPTAKSPCRPCCPFNSGRGRGTGCVGRDGYDGKDVRFGKVK